MKRQQLGIFGGTFDPIHFGHLFVADAVMAQAKLDCMLFLPVGDPAHRGTHASAAHRTAMVLEAIADNPKFILDETALRQAGPVYTADTMPLLRSAYPTADFSFVAGADSLVASPWRRLDEVAAALQSFYVVAREGTSQESLLPTLSTLPPELARRFVFLHLPLIDVSSTVIRDRVASHKPIRYLLPDSVERYIRKNGLYKERE
jgi:nicotinate-nucleotide adenylyltransferase